MWCYTLIVNLALRQVSCPDLGLTFPIAIAKSDENIHKGEWEITDNLFKPKAYYYKTLLPSSKVGDFFLCLNIPNADICFHGWYNPSVVEKGLRVSSGCFRMKFDDIKTLWFSTPVGAKVIVK